ncbi:hypothetical protein [Brotaphodocola sp.]|uniref:hypothetical protein n=1 Tax=Brotaphodocola sp. TaxID=3073577 RepID=UPI003D7ECA3C
MEESDSGEEETRRSKKRQEEIKKKQEETGRDKIIEIISETKRAFYADVWQKPAR